MELHGIRQERFWTVGGGNTSRRFCEIALIQTAHGIPRQNLNSRIRWPRYQSFPTPPTRPNSFEFRVSSNEFQVASVKYQYPVTSSEFPVTIIKYVISQSACLLTFKYVFTSLPIFSCSEIHNNRTDFPHELMRSL